MKFVRKCIFILWGMCFIYVVVWWYHNSMEYFYVLQAMAVLFIAFWNLKVFKESLTRYVINVYVCMLGAFQYLYEYTHAHTSIIVSEDLLRNREIRYIYFKHLLAFYLFFLIGLKIVELLPEIKLRFFAIPSFIHKSIYTHPFVVLGLYSVLTFAIKYFVGVGIGQAGRGVTVSLMGVWVYAMRGMNIYLLIILIEYGLKNYKDMKQLYFIFMGVFLINFADVFLGSRSAVVFPAIETFLVSDILNKKGAKVNIWKIIPIVAIFFATAALASFQRSGDQLNLVQFAIRRFTGYRDGIASTSMYINKQITASWTAFLKKMFLGQGYAIGTIYTQMLGFDIRNMGEAQPGFCIMAFLGGIEAICLFGVCVGGIMGKLEKTIINSNNSVEARFVASMLFFNMYMMVIQEGTIEGYLKTNFIPIIIYWCMNKAVKLSFRNTKKYYVFKNLG